MENDFQSKGPELMVVMPVYNEQASVRKAVTEFFTEIENWTERFVFLALDDGSSDDTPRVLNRLREQLGPRFEVIRHTNRGHGQTCMAGYRAAIERGIPFVLQIDSDGQCDPQYFFRFWRLREKADVIYGLRTKRDDGLRRMIASMAVRALLLFAYGVLCLDANVPYRLMRTEKLAPLLDRVPVDFSLANIGLAVMMRRDPAWKHAYVRIHFRERYGGEPSVKLSLFGRKAFQLYFDIRRMLSHVSVRRTASERETV
jgi:dolichol-phosphate mannosyltransferase